MLPTIAIFDSAIADCDSPTTLHRYALVRVQKQGDSHILSAVPEMRDDAKLVNSLYTYSDSIAVRLYPGIQMFETRIWSTAHSLQIGDQEYPIMDFEYAKLFRDWPYTVKVKSDTVLDCRRRQSQQNRLRMLILTSPLMAMRKPQVRPSTEKIPAFVGHLIKEKAIASGDCCPISQTPFSATRPATLLNCFHLFDPESIQRWISIKKECPICKADINGSSQI
jgi:hypothetical protein